MNVTGCLDGFATDVAFQRIAAGTCNVNLRVFWALAMFICFLRLLACCQKFRRTLQYNEYHQLKQNKDVALARTRRRSTISLISSSCSTITYFLLGFLIGFNVANVQNGISFSLYSMGYLPFLTDFTMMLLKIVRLGRGAIALPREELGEAQYLSQFNRYGSILLFLQSFAAAFSCICLIILSPILPASDALLGKLGFASKGIFQFVCTLGIVYQFERCIQLLKRHPEFKSMALKPESTSGPKSKLLKALQVLRQRQFFVAFFGGGVGLYLLVLTFWLPWTWATVLIGTGGIESVGHIVTEFFLKKRPRNSTTSPSSNKTFRDENKVYGLNKDHNNSAEPEHHSDSYGVISNFVHFPIVKIQKNFKNKPWIADLTRVTEEQSQNQSEYKTVGTLVE